MPSPVTSPPVTPAPGTRPLVPSTAAAPFDGDYRGGLQLGALADGSGYGRLSEALRQIEVLVVNSQGTGTVNQPRCPATGAVSLRISPTGSVDGEMDLLVTGTCAPLRTRMEGRAEGDLLILTVTDGRRSTDLSMRRSGKPD
jgi:hypothetical protein